MGTGASREMCQIRLASRSGIHLMLRLLRASSPVFKMRVPHDILEAINIAPDGGTPSREVPLDVEM